MLLWDTYNKRNFRYLRCIIVSIISLCNVVEASMPSTEVAGMSVLEWLKALGPLEDLGMKDELSASGINMRQNGI